MDRYGTKPFQEVEDYQSKVGKSHEAIGASRYFSQSGTLWLCQNSYWTWPFIVDFPIKNGDFHSYVKLPEGTLNGFQDMLDGQILHFLELCLQWRPAAWN